MEQGIERRAEQRIHVGNSRMIGRMAVLAGLLVLAAACVEDEQASLARVIVEADPASPLLMVVSTNFLTQVNSETEESEVLLLKADTLQLTGNYDEELGIAQFRRIFVMVRNDESEPEEVRVRVLLDGSEVFDVTDLIADGREVRYLFTSFSAS